MHLFKRKKNIVKLISVLLLVLLAVGIGTTGATISHRMKLTNQIRTPTVSTEIKEEFDPGTPENGKKTKIVRFKNSGTADIFIRVAYSETWSYREGEELLFLPNQSEGYDIVEKSWTQNWRTEWQDGGDGWYYYKKVLKPGQDTEAVLKSVDFSKIINGVERYPKADYELAFQVEAVQASGEIQVAKDAVKEVFGQSITLKNGQSVIVEDSDWRTNKYTASVEWGGEGN